MSYKYLFLSLLTTCLIIYASSTPDRSLWGNGSMGEQIIYNLAHIPAYGLLTFLWLKTFDGRNRNQFFEKVNTLILMGLILFAVSDEIYQSFIPGRMASCVDVGLNIVGILFGLSVFKICKAFNISREISTLKQKSKG